MTALFHQYLSHFVTQTQSMSGFPFGLSPRKISASISVTLSNNPSENFLGDNNLLASINTNSFDTFDNLIDTSREAPFPFVGTENNLNLVSSNSEDLLALNNNRIPDGLEIKNPSLVITGRGTPQALFGLFYEHRLRTDLIDLPFGSRVIAGDYQFAARYSTQLEGIPEGLVAPEIFPEPITRIERGIAPFEIQC